MESPHVAMSLVISRLITRTQFFRLGSGPQEKLFNRCFMGYFVNSLDSWLPRWFSAGSTSIGKHNCLLFTVCLVGRVKLISPKIELLIALNRGDFVRVYLQVLVNTYVRFIVHCGHIVADLPGLLRNANIIVVCVCVIVV